MSLDLGSETVTYKVTENTQLVSIDTRVEDPVLSVYRSKIWTKEDGIVDRIFSVPTVQRTLSSIANQKFTLAGTTLTGLQIAGFIKQAADDLRQEDINKG